MYPAYAQFSIEPIRDITRIARGGAIREESRLFVKAGHTLLGTVAGATVGEPDEVEPVFNADEVPVEQLEDCKAALDEMQAEPTFAAAGDGDEVKAIDPFTLLMIQVIGKALMEWIIKRRQGS
jgi:hypothetical protein